MSIFANLSTIQTINRKISSIEEQLEALPKLERRLRDLDMDFTTLFGKVRTMMNRVEKRAKVAEDHLEAPEVEEIGTDPSTREVSGLTPTQLKWQKQIAAERRVQFGPREWLP